MAKGKRNGQGNMGQARSAYTKETDNVLGKMVRGFDSALNQNKKGRKR